MRRHKEEKPHARRTERNRSGLPGCLIPDAAGQTDRGNEPEKYLRQGTKIAITGRIQTGSYTDREGRKVYTTEVVVEEAEFAESKNKNSNQQEPPTGPASGDGFMNIPEGVDDQLPFN